MRVLWVLVAGIVGFAAAKKKAVSVDSTGAECYLDHEGSDDMNHYNKTRTKNSSHPHPQRAQQKR